MKYFFKTMVVLFSLFFIVVHSNAGENQGIHPGDLVTLQGSSSSTFWNDRIISYQWKQISGPTVTLQNANSAVATFIAPEVSESTTLKFQLIKKKLFTNVTETVTITVLPNANQNQPPVAIIDANATEVNINEQIQLSAANSSDSDGEIASYAWYDETDTLIGSTREITYAFQEVGTHTLKLTVT
ncbi:MAG: PKD domain-containing protein, partial [Sulfurovaceae bacterium]